MFVLICVILSVIVAFFFLNRMREKHESVILVVFSAIVIGGLGGTIIGSIGDVVISGFLEVESKTKIEEHIFFPAYQRRFSDQSGVYEYYYEYYYTKKEKGEARSEHYISGTIGMEVEEGLERPVLREVTKTVGYKNPVNDFLFNSKKSVEITKKIILPKFF